MSSSTLRRVAAVASLALIAPIGVGIALADQLESDGDALIDGNGVIQLGNICTSQSATGSAHLAIRRQGNNNVFANSAVVTFSSPTTAGNSTVSASTPPQIQLSDGWANLPQNSQALSDIVTANVTVTAGNSAAANQSATVTYTGSGLRGDAPGTLVRTDTLTVRWNVVVCAPPNTAPTVTIQSPVNGENIEGNTLGGAHVVVQASATDAEDATAPVATCVPSSGVFAVGNHSVTCSATDSGGLVGNAAVWFSVVDTTAPTVNTPADITDVEATGPGGATVIYSGATASDIVDGPITPTCTPASGSTFALGTTTVNCEATDAAGNTGSASFDITVVDTTAPTVNVPGDMAVDPTGISGAVVDFGQVSATDIVDGDLTATCMPTSGSTFGFGSTKVTCTATDAAGNTGSGSFWVTVRPLTMSGFYSPVDMNGVWNTVKNGSTVPLKFEIFAGATELKTTSAVAGFTVKGVTCPSGATTDDIEFTTTGGTSLRFDAAGDQFVQNWQTPKKAGACYEVTMTAIDGSKITANFKLK